MICLPVVTFLVVHVTLGTYFKVINTSDLIRSQVDNIELVSSIFFFEVVGYPIFHVEITRIKTFLSAVYKLILHVW